MYTKLASSPTRDVTAVRLRLFLRAALRHAYAHSTQRIGCVGHTAVPAVGLIESTLAIPDHILYLDSLVTSLRLSPDLIASHPSHPHPRFYSALRCSGLCVGVIYAFHRGPSRLRPARRLGQLEVNHVIVCCFGSFRHTFNYDGRIGGVRFFCLPVAICSLFFSHCVFGRVVSFVSSFPLLHEITLFCSCSIKCHRLVCWYLHAAHL